VLKNMLIEAETVSVFYFSFISPCATGLTEKPRDTQLSYP